MQRPPARARYLLALGVLAAPIDRVRALDGVEAPPSSLAECDRRAGVSADRRPIDTCYLELAHTWPRGLRPVQEHLRAWLRTHPGDLSARLWLGILAHDEGQPNQAEEFLSSVAEGDRVEGRVEGEVLARAELAILLCYAGRDATAHLGRLDRLAREDLRPELRAKVLSTMAACARKAHDYGRAITLYRDARQVLSTVPPSFLGEQLTQQVIDGLGCSYGDSGRHHEAYAVFLEQSRKLPRDLFQLAVLKHRLASQSVFLADAGELSWEEVDRRVSGSLAMEAVLPQPHWPPYATRLLHAALQGPSQQTLAELDRAQAFWQPRSVWGVLVALRLKAKFTTDLDPSHPAAALAVADQALMLTRSTGNRWEEGVTLLTRAYVHRRAGEQEAAFADAARGLEQLDAVRDAQLDRMDRAWTAAESAFSYELVAGWLVDSTGGADRRDPLELAFAVLERHRARALREALATARVRLLSSGGDLGRRREQAVGEVARLEETLLSTSLAPDVRARALQDLAQAEQREETLRTELSRQAPRKLFLDGSAPTLGAVQAALGADQAMLSFQTWRREHHQDSTYTDGSSWLTVIWRDGVRTFRIPDADTLRPRIDFFRALIELRDGSEREGAIALHRDLLGPARAILGAPVRRLIIVPDGPLHQLPFEALRDEGGSPVGLRYSLTVAPSAALWLRWHEHSRRTSAPGPEAWIFANPAASPQDPPLPPLPFAVSEAQSIVSVLGGRARAHLAEAASEHLLKTARLDGVRVLHFAAHAVVDDVRPERSAVLLAPGSPEEDGQLQMREVVDLDLTDTVVVLASCRTASGTMLQGEGPLSLARAFFQAGSSTVVGSLLPLRDGDSAVLMKDLYRGLASGLSISSAVQEARARAIRAEVPTAAWAGIGVFGDGDLVPFPTLAETAPARAGWIVAAVLGAAICIASLLLRRGRSRHRPASAGPRTPPSTLPRP